MNKKITLSSDQLQVLKVFEQSLRTGEHLALCGAAGTGKTTVVKAMIAKAIQRTGRTTLLTATTHQAAEVLADATERTAITIHSAIGLRPDTSNGQLRFKPTGKIKIPHHSVVFVDEASMIDRIMLSQILSVADKKAALVVFVGDEYQLAPVGYKTTPFSDLPNTARLTKVHRQALDNPIIKEATKYRQFLDGHSFPRVVESFTDGSGIKILDRNQFNEHWLQNIYDNADCAERGTRFLCWTNENVVKYNRMAREVVYGECDDRPQQDEIVVANQTYDQFGEIIIANQAVARAINVGEKKIHPTWSIAGSNVAFEIRAEENNVIEMFVPCWYQEAKGVIDRLYAKAEKLQMQSNKAQDNGDYELVERLDEPRRAAWRGYYAAKNGIGDFRSLYAQTVHKSQGSTVEQVYVDLDDIGRNTKNDEISRLMYVALTRPKQRVYLTGSLPDRLYQTPKCEGA